jgi:DNA-binding CsgD family transcriptional regulator
MTSQLTNSTSPKPESAIDSIRVKLTSFKGITPRKAELLQLIAEGNPNKLTADILKINTKTVEKHRQSLMEKLNIHNTAGLTRHAIAVGVIESSVQVMIL